MEDIGTLGTLPSPPIGATEVLKRQELTHGGERLSCVYRSEQRPLTKKSQQYLYPTVTNTLDYKSLAIRRAVGPPDVRHAGIALPALERELRRRHTSARHRQHTHAVFAVPNDRRRRVGEDTRQRRQVTGPVPHRARELEDGRLALGD
ncbi:hypothetical protein GGR03_001180 [Aurantimonas endophytica]|uniref:Uncharacterized protein n=1 Tax=Aurantimonas endophytica TaxID=1522175 RepID=A0A7W6MNP9_9HYPH|nr:hypothetical protein [Aurantimonas endophytica]MCO6402235.1 hypothetical protein [Aurantimonas endophytica]